MARAGGAEGERGTCTICTNQINHMPGKIKGALAHQAINEREMGRNNNGYDKCVSIFFSLL